MEEKDNQAAAKNKTEEVTAINVISQLIETNASMWNDTLTVIDLSGQNIAIFEENVMLPANLQNLNLSHNKLTEIPPIILYLPKLEVLNLSYNSIIYFNDDPQFCHKIRLLDISYNQLAAPPYWIWAKRPRNLFKLNLSNNHNLNNMLRNGFCQELLLCNIVAKEVDVQNCGIRDFPELLRTFCHAEMLCLGAEEHIKGANRLIEIPCLGLYNCCGLKSLIACNTSIYYINPCIEKFKNLVVINLAHNYLRELPNEFCKLKNLEICVLSDNIITNLPEDMSQMLKLCRLYLDSNDLSLLPDTLSQLPHLRTLDLYNNHLNIVPIFENLDELDVAQNDCEEPDDDDYLEKKEKLRLQHKNRSNGRKCFDTRFRDDEDEYYHDDDSEYSGCTEETEEEPNNAVDGNETGATAPPNVDPPGSAEDWDSDDYWEPGYDKPIPAAAPDAWLAGVCKKIREGRFCPMDNYPPSVKRRVNYLKLTTSQVTHNVVGQFDDYSSDES